MKTRATSFLLATLAVVSLVLPALAAEADELPEEFPVESAENVEIVEEVESAIRLDGEPVDSVEYEIRNGVCYVTVSSFVSMLDPEAVVDEMDGTVRVSATTVTEVVPVSEATQGDELAEDNETVEESETANVVTADLALVASIGGDYFWANDRYLYVAGGLIDLNGTVAVPVRQLARVFNLNVGFDSLTGQVLLNHQEGVEPYLTAGDAAYDGDTLYWLSRIIYCESGNQPLLGKIAVGNVVMNRVKDSRFPDNVYDVLFQTNQFTPASTGSIYRDPNWDSIVAAKLVMDGAQVTDALFFNAVGTRSYASRTRTYVATIGDHAFYK